MIFSTSPQSFSQRCSNLALAVLACLSLQLQAQTSQEDKIQFNRDIRPILSDHCFACHGPDKNRREADLRLDTRDGLLGGESDPKSGVVRVGSAAESHLFQRITSTKDDEQMPPKAFGKPLSDSQIATLKRWIEEGANFEGHWAFQPIKEVASVDQAISPAVIDQWVEKGLKKKGMSIAVEADRRTLIRRLSFDLLGLPPTTESIEAFVADNRPDAYERLVDQLLDSPHFGERMAMWWLDLVRYADSVGYHGDQFVSISPYRDYVIKAFNENRPFDRFTIEQLAGDLLPDQTQELQIASGYNRLGMMSAEGGVQDKEYLAKYIAERVRNVGGTWMGVTLGCCECHDHKYDPFSTKEFYSMEAFFADIEERGLYAGSNDTGVWGTSVKVPSPDQSAKLQTFDSRIASLKSKLEESTPQYIADRSQWEKGLASWTTIRPDRIQSRNGASLDLLPDGSILASGKSPDMDTYSLHFSQVPGKITAVRIEVLPDASLPQKGPGRAGNGNFVLSELRGDVVQGGASRPLEFENATASYEQVGAAGGNPFGKWAVAAAIDHDKQGAKWGWAVMERAGQANHAVFPIQGGAAEGSDWNLYLDQNLDNPQHTLGRFRISVTTSPLPVHAMEGFDEATQIAFQTPANARNEDQQKAIDRVYRAQATSLEPVRKELAGVEEERKKLDASIPSTLITKTVAPRMIRVLARGNWMDDKGEEVKPAFPSVLPGFASERSQLNRLDLAKWLVAKEHPLTSRVLVNRLWKLLFGTGISKKLDDLGSQGEPPTHPELLDSLAAKMIESGWNIKAMMRQMVTSRTYRQSSNVEATKWQVDPANRWLGRQSRFRLDAELVRDNALAVSGLLHDQLGGPSVKPYQPAGYWAYLNFPQREWQNGNGTELYRRGLYTHWQRQYLHPALATFDAPSREECTADRPRSNTPLQSLVLLNDPEFVEAARALAASSIAAKGSTTDRLGWMIQRTLGRPIQVPEQQVLEQLLKKELESYANDPAQADKLNAIGAWRPSQPVPAVELAAWTQVARTLLNLHETITRQ